MLISNLHWLLKNSPAIFQQPTRLPVRIKLTARLLLSGLQHQNIIKKFKDADKTTCIGSLIENRPQIIGTLIWPYLCSDWDVSTRFNQIFTHCDVIDELGTPYNFSHDKSLTLLELDEIMPGLSVVLDQPAWFMREGLLVLNIFVNDFRAYSLPISLSLDDKGNLECLIGGIQGRNTDDILILYKQLTKLLHGIRPRDFLLETLRMFCKTINVVRIRAIADEYRQHRHPYFCKQEFNINYNNIWEDRGAEKNDAYFYQLPINPQRRAIEDIKKNKRSMYRKRYHLLDELEEQLNHKFK